MASTGRTLTKHFQIETRQHELFGLDLGDGIPRRMLVTGFVLTTGWFVALWWVAGAPTSDTASFYLLPPVVTAYFGFQENRRQPRRRNLTAWAITARYLLAGHRPIIHLGTRRAERCELIPAPQRFARFYLALAPVFPQVRAWLDAEADEPGPDLAGAHPAGRPIVLVHTATLYGFDHMQSIRQEKKR